MTVFRNPTLEFINYVMALDEKVLLLNPNVKPLFRTDTGAILQDGGKVFVKGIFVTDAMKDYLIFGYDLNTETNRDRNMVSTSELANKVGNLIEKLNEPDIIKAILTKSTEQKE